MWGIERNKCLRCGACVGVCPKLALELKESGISHDQELCIDCGICMKVCPVGAIKVEGVKNGGRKKALAEPV